jgi:hypothetical protein
VIILSAKLKFRAVSSLELCSVSVASPTKTYRAIETKMSNAKIKSRQQLMQWFIRECQCDPVIAEKIAKHFSKYYSKHVSGNHFPMEPELQARNIILAYAAGYLRGTIDE